MQHTSFWVTVGFAKKYKSKSKTCIVLFHKAQEVSIFKKSYMWVQGYESKKMV